MPFYSYEYIESQVSVTDTFMYMVTLLLLSLLAFFGYKYYKNRQDTRYRELVIIVLLFICVLIGIQFDHYHASLNNNDQYRSALALIESVSEKLSVSINNIYVNTSVYTDGVVIKVESNFYRAVGNNKQNEYLLEQINFVEPSIELVERESK